MTKQFTTIFFQTDGVWVGFAEDLPGANTQGATLEEAKENLEEAIEMVLDALHEQNKSFMPPQVETHKEVLSLEFA